MTQPPDPDPTQGWTAPGETPPAGGAGKQEPTGTEAQPQPDWAPPQSPAPPDPSWPPPVPGQTPAPEPTQAWAAPGWGAAAQPGRAQGSSAPWGAQQNWAPESTRWAPAMRPGAIPLRPLSVGEILDGAITYIRRNPLATLGTAAVLTAVSGAIQAVVLALTANRLTAQLTDLSTGAVTASDAEMIAMSLGQSVGLLLGSVVGWVIGILATGMLTVMMGAAVLGRKLDIAGALRVFAPRLPGLIGLTFLISTAVFGIWGLGVVIAVALGFALGIPGIVLGVLLVIGATLAAIWLYVKLILAPVVLVLEECGPIAAWRRSMVLVQGSWWRIFGISLLAMVIASTIAAIVSVPFQAVAGAITATEGEPDALFWALITIGSVIAGVITLPFTAGVTSLLYVDRRMRREGLDLVLQSRAGQANAGEDASGTPLDSDQWITTFRPNRPTPDPR